MPVRAVLFDVDDTLFDYSGACRTGILAYLAELGLPAGEPAWIRWKRLELAEYARYLAGECGFVEQRRARVRGMVDASLSDAGADGWFAGYARHYQAAWTVFDDVIPALDSLAGVRLGVLTNSDSGYQTGKLAELGMDGRFQAVVGVDVAGAAKPEPAAFLAGCAAVGVGPGEAAYVGDRLDIDALGAAGAGLQGVWLDRSGAGEAPAAVARITTLTDLPAVLDLT